MSCVEIVGFTKNKCFIIGEVNNAWKGAMAIWKILEKKYLPPYQPSWWNPNLNKEPPSRCLQPESAREIWDLSKSEKLSQNEKIVLNSTFDRCIVNVDNIDKVIFAFREFEGVTNLKEQADLIEQTIKKDSKIIAIGWNQTSVCENQWMTANFDEKTEEYISYNLEKDTNHWFLPTE